MKQPKNPFHPGVFILEEFLKPLEMSQAEFAGKLGWTNAKLNEIIKGKRGVSADAALDLARVLKTSPLIWLKLQMSWDLDQAIRARSKTA